MDARRSRTEYRTDIDFGHWVDRLVTVGKKRVGYVVEVSEVRAEGIRVRIAFDGERIPWGLE